MDSLYPIGCVVVAAFLGTLVTGPLVRKLAIKLDLFDRPDAGLKPHEKPIPYLGGLAIFIGWIAGITTAKFIGGVSTGTLIPVALAGTILMLVGLIDDIRHLPPKLRLVVQALSSLVLVFSPAGRELGEQVFTAMGVTVSETTSLLILIPLAAILFIAATNATNLIDGLDGLCAGVTGVSAIGFAWLFWQIGVEQIGGQSGLVLALATLGGCLGFLIFNFKPASMFMGDSGSLLLGGSVASMIFLATLLASWRGLIAGVFIAGFPILDTSLAVVRRKLNGKPLFIGDRSHFYDQLRDRGMGVRQTVLTCYAIAAVFFTVGNLLIRVADVWAVATAIATPVVIAALLVRYGFLRVDDSASRSTGDNPSS